MCVNATVKIITMEGKTNDLTEILTQAINKIKMRQGEKFELDKINLAELVNIPVLNGRQSGRRVPQ